MKTRISNFGKFMFPLTPLGYLFLLGYCFTPVFSQSTDKELKKEWLFEYQREEIAPAHWIDKKYLFKGSPTLAISGNNKSFANGQWTRTISIQPEQYYQFATYFKTLSVEEDARCVLAKIIWYDEKKERIGFREYPSFNPEEKEEGWNIIRQTYQAPKDANYAKVELIYRWDGDGTVYFGETRLTRVQKPGPRSVRLAAVHYRPENSNSPGENLEQFAKFLQVAGDNKADIVCLPEGTTVAGTGKSYVEVSEPIPGPSTEYLGKIAAEHHMYIVAGIYEREGPVVYNTSVLIGRKGELIGKYRKVSLPREEIEGGITPGNSFPVFDTDFGRIGMMICWDVSFPEPASALAKKGAEVIFMPIWGGNLTLAKARAIENQVYLVSSTYGMKTGVFDLEGKLIAEGTENNPVAIVDVDLNEQKLWPFLGEFKNRIARERPPSSSIK